MLNYVPDPRGLLADMPSGSCPESDYSLLLVSEEFRKDAVVSFGSLPAREQHIVRPKSPSDRGLESGEVTQ
jgi:hypothetical protein